jgi:hypothetical protein
MGVGVTNYAISPHLLAPSRLPGLQYSFDTGDLSAGSAVNFFCGRVVTIAQSGGSSGLRDRGALESAVAQSESGFGGEEAGLLACALEYSTRYSERNPASL